MNKMSIHVAGPTDPKSSTAFVLVKVGSTEYWFRRDCGSEADRVAVVSYLGDALAEQIKHVRQVEYERGYKDGRRRKAKAFTGATTLYVPDWMVTR